MHPRTLLCGAPSAVAEEAAARGGGGRTRGSACAGPDRCVAIAVSFRLAANQTLRCCGYALRTARDGGRPFALSAQVLGLRAVLPRADSPELPPGVARAADAAAAEAALRRRRLLLGVAEGAAWPRILSTGHTPLFSSGVDFVQLDDPLAHDELSVSSSPVHSVRPRLPELLLPYPRVRRVR